MDISEYELIDEKAAAKFLGVSHRSLQTWRVKGGGPNFIRLGPRIIRYRIAELVAWSSQHLYQNTMEYDLST